MRKMRRMRPLKPGEDYREIWRMVDGAVRDAIYQHPTYFPGGNRANLRSAITKRVVGALTSWAEKSVQGRDGVSFPELTVERPLKLAAPSIVVAKTGSTGGDDATQCDRNHVLGAATNGVDGGRAGCALPVDFRG